MHTMSRYLERSTAEKKTKYYIPSCTKSLNVSILCSLSDILTKYYSDNVSRKPQYKDVYRRTVEMPQCAHTYQVNCCLKVHNAHLKLLSPISGYDTLPEEIP